MGLRTPLPRGGAADRMSMDRIGVERGLLESAGAAFNLARMETGMAILAREQVESEMEADKGEKIPPERLNQMYRDLSEPFTSPMTRLQAQMTADRQRERDRLKRKIANGPRGALGATTQFGAGMLAHMMDPLEMGASLLATGGLSYVARGAALTGRLARIRGAAAAGSAEATFAREAAEGLAGNLAVEPIIAFGNAPELEQYTATDSLMSVFGGAIGVAGLKYGLNRGASFVRGLGSRHVDTANTTATGQLASDRAPDVDRLTDDWVDEVASQPKGEIPGGRAPYEYRPMTAADVPSRRFYAALEKDTFNFFDEVETRGAGRFSDDLGEPLQLTDNPNQANGAAARKMNLNKGRIFEVELRGENWINLDRPLPDRARETVEPLLQKAENPRPDKAPSKKVRERAGRTLRERPGREVLERVRDGIQAGRLEESALQDVHERLADKGFSGGFHSGGQFLRRQVGDSNIVMPFRPRESVAINPERTIVPSRKSVPRTPMNEARQVGEETIQETSHIYHDAEAAERVNGLDETPPKSPEPSELRKQEDAVLEELEAREREGALDAEDRETLDKIRQSRKDVETLDTMQKAALQCIGGVTAHAG